MKTILVVEDENDLRMNLQEILEREGFNILSANNGIEALELTGSIEPDLILSDIRMPHMDGFEFLRTLQKEPDTANIPFIFLTAKVEMQDLRDGMILGADDYLMKPFKIDDVLKAVNSRLRKRDNHLRVVNDFKKMLSRKIPHELLTPLVGILGFSDLIKNDVELLTSDEIKSMADKIKISGQRLHRRIQKFVTYMDIMSLVENKPKDKNQQSGYEIGTDYVSFKLSNIVTSFNRCDDLIISCEVGTLNISEQHFEILFNELIENADKFSESGTPIKISGKSEKDFYKIEIIDYGQGMKNNDITQIDLFNQNGIECEISEGLGIGLAIVQKIVELYNGAIKISSAPVIQTQVEIFLPQFHKQGVS